MKANTMDIAVLAECVRYEPETGKLYWLKQCARKVKVGSEAGTRCNGRLVVTIKTKKFTVPRLAWALHYGAWPEHTIDHINMDPTDNRIENLRDVPQAVNAENVRKARAHNRLGLLGVKKDKSKFLSRITVRGVEYHLGSFDTPAQAHQAYIDAKRELHEGCTL